ncbi:MAG TPA: molybdopterin molybdenumtransferase MoeA [Persephonella sp.]|uniref:Molybdopterin molybdenumtransferase n=1 Tax=Persephonella marina (strain DSM 14350 / EX-H1) TaxID=123214 RepID=C0QQG0_PERMH|nr:MULTISPECIES: gephyrin-like molybdotransferase Glp [Persephonella]ACO04906.1 molybdenum cofactor biosynthesis protein A [Persephonella marina EX-H1]HCB69488.1 molybdopterin molybdenumtransferase MoeA [Persephonella sp.]
MIRFDEAMDIIIENTKILQKEKVFLPDALGRVLAEDIYADRDNPPADNSGMDGFAVRYEDIKGASEDSPAVLKIVAESKAGGELVKVEKGTAAYIYTGGLIPEGADTVVQKELTKVEDDKVFIFQELPEGSNIRPQGGDYRKGDLLIKSGKKIRSAELGILSSVNKPTVYVYREPVVGILTTGDEILDLGEPVTKLSQIRTSNTYSLYGQIKSMGAKPVILGFAKDDPEDIKEKLSYAESCDILLTTGGISVGEYDLVKDFVTDVLGVEILFWKVAQKPGKPVAFGVWGDKKEKLFFGIPGNPVAAMTVVETMVKPAVRKMRGESYIFDPVVKAKLSGGYKRKKAERLEFIKVSLELTDEGFVARAYKKQGSNILTSMLYADGFGLVDIGVKEIKDGEMIDVIVFDTDFMRKR